MVPARWTRSARGTPAPLPIGTLSEVGDAVLTVAAPPAPLVRTWTGVLRRALPHLPVAILIVAYAVRFSLLTVAVHDGYGTPAYDMADADQGVWLLAHFHAPFSTVMGRDIFADHTSFIWVLLVPLFWVYPHTAALLVVQSMLLAAAAIPIYLYARRRLESTPLATLLTATYLLNPALQWGNLEQFHVECFTVLLIAVALYAALESRGRLLFVSVGLLFLCKEDVGLLVGALGLWVAWRRNLRWGLTIVAMSVVWSVIATELIIRPWIGQATVHAGRLPFGGFTGTLGTMFTHPGKFLTYLRSDRRGYYMWQMFTSFGWVLFRAPEVAAVGVLVLAANVVTSWPYSHLIQYHYSMPLVPVFAFGTVFAIGAMTSQYARRVATTIATACAFTACVVWGLAPSRTRTCARTAPRSMTSTPCCTTCLRTPTSRRTTHTCPTSITGSTSTCGRTPSRPRIGTRSSRRASGCPRRLKSSTWCCPPT
jgi:uncharacterized membrane protein